MIKNSKKLYSIEDQFIRRRPQNLKQNWKLLEAMYREASTLGAFPPRDPLDGLDLDIRIAKAINSVPKAA
jgi:hypothetical protein